MPSSDLTFALAIWGALAGSASATTAVYNASRDRPRLAMGGHTTMSLDAPPAVDFELANIGQRATTVRAIGFYAHKTRVLVYDDEEAADRGEVKTETEGEMHAVVASSIFLEPGETKHFDATAAVLGMGIWADEPLRAYAIDIRGRRVWGEAAPIVRRLFGSNPPLEQLPDHLRRALEVETPEKFRLPAQVEPRWKLWKRRELRKPGAWGRLE